MYKSVPLWRRINPYTILSIAFSMWCASISVDEKFFVEEKTSEVWYYTFFYLTHFHSVYIVDHKEAVWRFKELTHRYRPTVKKPTLRLLSCTDMAPNFVLGSLEVDDRMNCTQILHHQATRTGQYSFGPTHLAIKNIIPPDLTIWEIYPYIQVLTSKFCEINSPFFYSWMLVSLSENYYKL